MSLFNFPSSICFKFTDTIYINQPLQIIFPFCPFSPDFQIKPLGVKLPLSISIFRLTGNISHDTSPCPSTSTSLLPSLYSLHLTFVFPLSPAPSTFLLQPLSLSLIFTSTKGSYHVHILSILSFRKVPPSTSSIIFYF